MNIQILNIFDVTISQGLTTNDLLQSILKFWTHTDKLLFYILLMTILIILTFYVIDQENHFGYNLITPNLNNHSDYIRKTIDYNNIQKIDTGVFKDKRVSNLFNSKEESIEEQEHEIVFMLDRGGHFLYANDNALLLFNSNIEDVLGESIFNIYESHGIFEKDWFNEVKTKYIADSILKFVDLTDKEEFVLMNYHANLDTKGKVESYIVTGNDVSALMKSETLRHFYTGKDQLTGLLNQYGMFEKLKQMHHAESALAFFIETTHFTEIHDYYGHEVANQLLNEIVKDLQSITDDTCIVARYTESKFVVICFNGKITESTIENYLRKIEDFVYRSYKVGKLDLQVDKKVGYAVYPTDTNQMEEIISLSSIALKDAITRNSSELTRYNNKMKEKLKYNLELANKLKLALDNNKIQVFFQKAINCTSNQTYVIEELSRWYDEEYGYISPLEFFRIAKETNQLDRLDRYMVMRSLTTFKDLKTKKEFESTKLTINLAPSTLLNLKFYEYFDNAVKEMNLLPEEIYIEISEGTFVNKLDLCISRINMYKQSGYLIALDDFGIEYSSLAILERVDFDIIKIDAHFVRNINNISNQEIIKMIRRITKITNKEMIAEGVETKEQSEMLKDLGCLIQQGYYLHKPENLINA